MTMSNTHAFSSKSTAPRNVLHSHVGTATLALLFGLVCGGGCASTKIAVTPAAKQIAVTPQNSTGYRLKTASVDISYSDVAAPLDKDKFAQQFTQVAKERYPSLFKEDAAATPINVRIKIHQDIDQSASLGVYICTLCILGGILPSVPWETQWQVDVRVEDDRGSVLRSSQFRAVDRGWWSILSPFGLITIPGESDAPKVSKVFSAGPGQIPVEHRTYVLVCASDALAAQLQSPLPPSAQLQPYAVEPAQPLPSVQPMPSQQQPSPAVALPLPSQTVAPY